MGLCFNKINHEVQVFFKVSFLGFVNAPVMCIFFFFLNNVEKCQNWTRGWLINHHTYIKTLQTVFDTIFLVFSNLVYASATHLSPLQYRPFLHAIPVLIPLVHIALTGSVYTIVAIAFERYTTMTSTANKVCKHFRLLKSYPIFLKPPKMCRTWCLIIIITTFAFGFNIVRFFELTIVVDTKSFSKRT